MSGPFKWVPLSTSSMPHGFPAGAIRAGTDIDGTSLYVGRARHGGDTLPAKVIPSKNACYVAHGGQEILKDEFEVLVPLTVSWRASSHGSVPPGAVAAGTTTDGETLYIGRVSHDGCTTPGKIHPSHGTCYFSFAGAENSSTAWLSSKIQHKRTTHISIVVTLLINHFYLLPCHIYIHNIYIYIYIYIHISCFLLVEIFL